ncbi:MAG: cation:H+ antiporter [Gammaproteobacteria bacterium]
MPRQLVLVFLFFWLGLLMGVVSANFSSEAALYTGDAWGLSQAFLGSIVATLGCRLPGHAVSLGPPRTRNSGLSVGYLLGNNIFDTLVPLGAAALLTQITLTDLIWRFEPVNLCLLTIGVAAMLTLVRQPRFSRGAFGAQFGSSDHDVVTPRCYATTSMVRI